ncbi:zinc finger, C3HC4 type (RING finger) domain containing protein [Acanthamoeba castellanii str. Neff]|uniref:Zinc finger, C3HC4 type (RING finger) domain containing protein n=1 Tax=Acanthamoeba castellanii (strain ATCC 30010 / Neff) TaxID=1257118 RepID=L8HIR0_ACACF|nr:zinc finger, C3HC4 type (RING finger) domain containing protein [Acanthamoeba castellanii str. Neff]ELR25494.1 zinc finger, C3HC4 type (RING finger) domain containing protein [Acanthamoeba castellanii str. Neff]
MNGDDLFGGWGEPAWGNTGTGAATNAASLSLGLWGNTADELRCGMCGHYYNDPRTLGCGHSYCASCLTQSAAGVGAVGCLVCGRQERLPPLMGVDGLQKNYDLADRAEAAARSAPPDEADDTSAGGAYDFQDFQAALPPTIPQHQPAPALMPMLSPVSAAPTSAAAPAARPSGAPAAFDPFGDLLQPASAAAAPVDFFGGGGGGSSPFASSTSFLAPVPATVAAAAPAKPATPQHAKLAVREDLTESMDEFTKFLLTEAKSSTPVSANPYFPNGDPFAMPAPAPAKKAPLAFLSSSPPPSSPAAATSAPTTPTAQSSYRVSSVVPSRVTPTSSSSSSATASSSSMTSMYPSSSPYHPSSSASAYPMLSSSPPSASSAGLSSSPPPATSASDSSSSTVSGSTSTSSYLSSMSPASWFSKKDSTKAASSSASASSSSSSSSTSSGVLSFFTTKSSTAPAATATTAAAAAPAAAVAHSAAAPPRPAAPAQHHHHHSQAVTDHSQHQDAGRINFSNFLLQKEGIRQKFNGWLESLWFKPAGFFDNVQSATMQFVFVPFWMFDVKVQTAYQGKVCRVVMTGSDAQAKKVESWSEAQGNRSALYPHKTVCACQSVQERKLVQQFTAPWQVNKIHFGVDRNPQQPPQAPQQQPPQHQQPAEEGWAVGKFFKKIADSVEKAAAMPATVVKPPPPNLLLPALPWEGVWKEFEAELVKLETQECSNKLRVENGADKVKDVALNYQVQLNRRLVYFPVCLTSYQYNGKLYRVVINGHTGEVIGDRPYGTGKIGELGKAGLSVVGDYLFKRGGSSSS